MTTRLPLPEAAMAYFYGHLFASSPAIRAMFPAAMGGQFQRVHQALDPGVPVDQLRRLGRAHRKYGVRREDYEAFRAALLATCRHLALPEADKAAVTAAFDRAASVMIAAADADAARAPAWWTAEVTRHERAAPGIAVLTLRPGQPLPYAAGQHVHVLSPRWPRQWRRYSLGCAPRPDGSLTLHVRAVPGGLVSGALVHYTRPGDMLLLGQPDGTMTADAGSGGDVLCLAGGTGIAPLLAITEAITRANAAATVPGSRRDVIVYHGARTVSGLYALPLLRAMAARTPGLRVIPATSADRVPQAIHATIPGLAARARWQDREVYISGPDAMITATVRALLAAGAAPGQLHYDR
jgi:NAD(P)H-flavin reductase